MLLSHQQKYILQVLKTLSCIRVPQLKALMQAEYPTITEPQIIAMVRQLRLGNYAVSSEHDVLRMNKTPDNPLLLAAVDIMLEVTGNHPEHFFASTNAPALLYFTYGEQGHLYTVMYLTAETLHLPAEITVKPGERIIWISDGLTVEACHDLPEHQFFAQREEDGIYHFYQ